MRLGQVRDEAHKVLAQFGVTGARDIHLEQIAAAHGAEVVLDELDGAMARVIQLNGRARIYISTRV
ncbi:MAG TPA: hypothetical protein VK427_00900, partial [Kofleriaceae bacterium]|nr:hypothetical protein [Kofleriaceae bacterium]